MMKIIIKTFLLFFLTNVYADTEDTKIETFFFKVNPQGTYLRTDTAYGFGGFKDVSVHPSTIHFGTGFQQIPQGDALINVDPGDVIRLEMAGAFLPGPGWAEAASGGLGVFSKNGSSFLYPNPKRTTAVSAVTPNTCTQNIPTDIPQDFYLPVDRSVDAQIPLGANQISFTYNDCFFADNTDPFPDYGSMIKVVVFKSFYKIKKKVYDLANTEFDPAKVDVLPINTYKGYKVVDVSYSIRKVHLDCVDFLGENVEDCRAVIRLSPSEDTNLNGGHDHIDSSRPLGIIEKSLQAIKINAGSDETYRDFDFLIPKDGIDFYYRAPEVAGVVNMKVVGVDPNGYKITEEVEENNMINFYVKIAEDLVAINNPGIRTLRDFTPDELSKESHPRDGYYLTRESNNKLNKIIEYYELIAADEDAPGFDPVRLRTTAASLFWGGLYDVNENWMPEHKGHRHGNEIDLSTNVFDVASLPGTDIDKDSSRRALKEAITSRTLRYPTALRYPSTESPERYRDHWHVFLYNFK